MADFVVHTDGGARGNPGPAAIGVVIDWPNGTSDKKHRAIGETTNNQAEYRAVLWAWHLLAGHTQPEDKITFYLDSELVVKQLKGEYRVKDPGLAVLYRQVKQEEEQPVASCDYRHIKREENVEADAEVNLALDALAK
ncbi:MAG: ribonuclease HI family protein [bacterium]|nr:ribonuclease HI family protein [bacterium]